MNSDPRALFEYEAKTLDPQWVAIAGNNYRPGIGAEVHIEDWPPTWFPQPATENWATKCAKWLNDSNAAIRNSRTAGQPDDMWVKALEGRCYTNGTRLKLLLKKGINVQASSWVENLPGEFLKELEKKFSPFGDVLEKLPYILAGLGIILVLWWFSKRD